MIRRTLLPLATASLLLAGVPASAAGAQGASKNPIGIRHIETDPPNPNSATKDIRFTLRLINKGTGPVLGGDYAGQGIRFFCGAQCPDPCKDKKKEAWEPPNVGVTVTGLFPGEERKVTVSTGQWPAGHYCVNFFLDPVHLPGMQMDSQTIYILKVSRSSQAKEAMAPAEGMKPFVPTTTPKVGPAGGRAAGGMAQPFVISPTPLATQPAGRRVRAPLPTATPLPRSRKS
jgi:hypothetical protein